MSWGTVKHTLVKRLQKALLCTSFWSLVSASLRTACWEARLVPFSPHAPWYLRTPSAWSRLTSPTEWKCCWLCAFLHNAPSEETGKRCGTKLPFHPGTGRRRICTRYPAAPMKWTLSLASSFYSSQALIKMSLLLPKSSWWQQVQLFSCAAEFSWASPKLPVHSSKDRHLAVLEAAWQWLRQKALIPAAEPHPGPLPFPSLRTSTLMQTEYTLQVLRSPTWCFSFIQKMQMLC